MKAARILLLATLWLGAASPSAATMSAFGTDTRQILAEQQRIQAESTNSLGKYSRFDEAAQARLQAAQRRIFELIENGRTLEQLSKNEQVALLNAVEEVKAILDDNRDDQLECWREKKLGSSIKITRCETVAMRERLRQESRQWKGDPGVCQMGGSGDSACGPPPNRGN